MKTLKKSAEVIAQVFGAVVGYNFTTPLAHTVREHPYLRFGG